MEARGLWAEIWRLRIALPKSSVAIRSVQNEKRVVELDKSSTEALEKLFAAEGRFKESDANVEKIEPRKSNENGRWTLRKARASRLLV